MTKKTFCTKTNCQDADLEKYVNDGWQIQFMQFMPDAKLHVVFVREVAVAEAAPEPVVVVPVKEIASPKLPLHIKVLGIEGDLPKVAAAKTEGAAPKPCPEPVMAEALRRGRETFERVSAENAEKMRRAAASFLPNPIQ